MQLFQHVTSLYEDSNFEEDSGNRQPWISVFDLILNRSI